MSHKRIPKRKAAIAVGGVAALGAAALLLPNANASQTDAKDAAPKVLKSADASDLASLIASQIGEAFGGAYYDASKQQVIINIVGNNSNVVNEIKKAGAVPRSVDNSMSKLTTAAKTLKTDATIPGTAWSIDPKTNQVQVTADSTVTGAKWAKLTSTVDSLGSGVATVKKSAGTFKTFVSGGDAIFAQTDAGGVRCSLGFNVTASDGAPAFLTAGHCGVAAKQWSDSQDGQPIATVDQATFPGAGDFSLVKYDDPNTQTASEVNVGNGKTVQITQAADATVGQQVLRMGSTTGLHDGSVTGLDATVNFQSETDPNGVDTVTGLIQTDVCAEAGDSGGSLFTQDGSAIGLTSGGSGDCTVGGETFFQPVTAALQATGATLGAGDAGAGDAGAGDASAAATDPAATDPAATDPAATDPAATDPAATDPAATDPAATDDPAAGDQSGTGDEQPSTGMDAGSGLVTSTP
ncbi:S1 family peptidase [Streptomyces sp. NBC_01340]|uniref:S1 family peptidase n=1 Tax=unclassified Streptomyces TaxID=2593676 RepID=UPI00224FDF08|nr:MULTISPECIES: S1 family peptidase [unclassified Streptomyces]MCX4451893.1 S1 family peptidase [Streptomyces sp. NBC_01719]MCX4491253.1 S1 family peptidase [Streptomyces sp. NBC_01728]WSI36577.1 S1 family peptidase [Streptomyces sp. NBC_01340]